MTRCNVVLAMLALLLLRGVGAQAADAENTVFAHATDGRTLLGTTLAAPAHTLASAQVLKGSFTHERHVSEMRQPLTSTGEFVFARGLGVYWHTVKPFDSAFVLTNAGLVQRDEGVETLRLNAQDQPAVHMLADIFFALFTLDVHRLEQNFALSAQTQGERWVVGLQPKSTAVGSVFSSATVSGAEHVEQVVLTDGRGDRTVITLQDVRVTSEPPDAAVRALFAR